MKTIEIIVGTDGSTRVTTHGFSGGGCRDASRFLEHALGKTTAETLTAEYHQAETAQSVDQRQSAG
jgi:hypothetical protein